MIEHHVTTILDSAEYAMQHTNLSDLLFLNPLSIACSWVCMEEQKKRLKKLCMMIQNPFAVANVSRTEVEELWRTPVLEQYA